MKAEKIYNFLNETAPFSTAAQWDNTGLSVGSLDENVTKVILSLDVTNDVISYAEASGAQLVLTHHPLLFDPVRYVQKGSPLYNAVASGITFISSHTCLDKAKNGVNTCLAEVMGIKNTYVSQLDEFLNIGEIKPLNVNAFAALVKKTLNCSVSFNNAGKLIKKVAFCSGAGGDLVEAAATEGADALLTGEAKHHEFLLAQDLGISLICAGHYETENIVLEYLCKEIKDKFNDLEVEIYSPKVIEYI